MHVRALSTTNNPILTAAVAAVAAAPLITAAVMLLAGAPVAWLWLAWCATATIPLLIWFLARGRFFEPLPILLAVAALLFVARPLQLFLGWEDLFSYLYTRDSLESLTLLETQEIALYVSGRLREPLETTFARAQGACALFLAALLVGYWMARWVPLRQKLAGLGGRTSVINERAAIACALAIGVAAQAAIIARAGGPIAALETAVEQRASSDSFVLFLLAGFSSAALVIWVAWRRPRERLEKALLALSIGTVSALWLVTGSRARVFITLLALVVVVNYLWRRWRTRELLVAGILLLAFASSAVVLRTVADEQGLREAASVAAERVLDQRVILNDLSGYDSLMLATTIYGRDRPHRHGGFLVDAVRSYVPRRLDSGKPDGGDIVFRREVWGNQFTAGRPPTAIGDFFIDFGLWGVAVGGLMLGAVCRLLLSLLGSQPARTSVPGWPIRAGADSPLRVHGWLLFDRDRLRPHARAALPARRARLRTAAGRSHGVGAARVRRAPGGITLIALLAVCGCGSLQSDDAGRRVEGPWLLTRAAVEGQPPGSPQRTVFEWWRALQFDDASVASSYYSKAVAMSPARMERQLAVGATGLGLLSRPRLVEVTEGAGQAKVFVLLESKAGQPNGRIDVKQTARAFDLTREDDEWKLTDNSYLERAVRLQRELFRARTQQNPE